MSEPVAPKLSALQMIEQEIGQFFKQREVAIANIHALDGAIQAYQQLMGKLRAEAAKVEDEVKKVVSDVEGEANKIIDFVKKEI